jgi:hypothetical protein
MPKIVLAADETIRNYITILGKDAQKTKFREEKQQ